jgi:hypothetical protein
MTYQYGSQHKHHLFQVVNELRVQIYKTTYPFIRQGVKLQKPQLKLGFLMWYPLRDSSYSAPAQDASIAQGGQARKT